MQIEKIVSGRIDNNTYVLKNDANECLIVDASASLEEIKNLVGDSKVVGVLLTHGHYDHFVNLDKIINEYQTKCYLSELELDKLYSPKLNYSPVFNTFFCSKLEEESFEKLYNEQQFSLGQFSIRAMLTPGHTNGCMCYLIDNKHLFTGDTLFENSHGRTDLLTSDEKEMKNSLKFLKDNFGGFKFFAGHGEDGVVRKWLNVVCKI